MKCPKCGTRAATPDTEFYETHVDRTHDCLNPDCGHKWRTVAVAVPRKLSKGKRAMVASIAAKVVPESDYLLGLVTRGERSLCAAEHVLCSLGNDQINCEHGIQALRLAITELKEKTDF